MNLSDYFCIVSSDDRVIHIQLRGFWSDDFVEQCGAEFLTVFRSVINKYDGRQFIILTDGADFNVPSNKGRELLVKGMRYCQNKQLYLAIDLNPSPLGSLGLGRIAKEADMQDNRVIMGSMDEAQEFIAQCRGKLV